MNADFCGALAALVPAQVYRPGVELIRQGSAADDVYYIKSGLVKLVRVEPEGTELIIDLRFPGWLLGAASAIMQTHNPTTVVTVTDCSLRRVSGECFRQLLERDPDLSWYLHQMHSREVLEQIRRVAQLACWPARYRLEQLLRNLLSILEPTECQEEIRLELPLKYWEIAQLIATTPPYLCQLFEQLEIEGVLYRRKGWLIISNPQKLRYGYDM